MRHLLVPGNRGVSLMVSYVLLITIAISLSVGVYSWLKFYVSVDDIGICPEGVKIALSHYECDNRRGVLNISVKNRGLFSVDGFIVRVNDRAGSSVGLYILNDTGVPLGPGEDVENIVCSFSSAKDSFGDTYHLSTINLVEVQPFIIDGHERLYCGGEAVQGIVCS